MIKRETLLYKHSQYGPCDYTKYDHAANYLELELQFCVYRLRLWSVFTANELTVVAVRR